MINDPAYPQPSHCDGCGDVLDTYYGEWYREGCYCETCGLPLCRDCYDKHLWDDHMIPEVRAEFERLETENSDLLRKTQRAVELLRRAKGLIENWGAELYPGEYNAGHTINPYSWKEPIHTHIEEFLHELEGKR